MTTQDRVNGGRPVYDIPDDVRRAASELLDALGVDHDEWTEDAAAFALMAQRRAERVRWPRIFVYALNEDQSVPAGMR